MSDEITIDNIVDKLLQEVPEFKATYDRHMEYYDEIFIYLLIGMQLFKFILDVYKRLHADPHAMELLTRTLGFVERAANSTDDSVTTLIHTGFMEKVERSGNDYKSFTAFFGPTSQNMLRKIDPNKWRSDKS